MPFLFQKTEKNYKIRGKVSRYLKTNKSYLEWQNMQDLYDLDSI